MRLPRWLFIGMVAAILLLPIRAGGWWWTTWPERTIREYVARVGDGDFDRANAMMQPPTTWHSFHGLGSETLVRLTEFKTPEFLGGHACSRMWQSWFRKETGELEFVPRGISDVIVGRAAVTLRKEYPHPPETSDWGATYRFTAKRGKVTVEFKEE